MEENESILSSYYHHLHHRTSTTTTATTTTSTTNGMFSDHHHHHHHHNNNNNNNNNNASSETTPLVFPPHSVTGRAPVAASVPQETVRRKRGRPRKYGAPSQAPPIASLSASSTKKVSTTQLSPPRKKEPSSASKKAQLLELRNAGQGFTPHVITVAAGEDVAQKIMSFVQQRKGAVCILSASGSISNASLRQPATLGGNVTYEGRFEILSLSGSFLYSDIGGSSSRTGGLSLCLSGTDGSIIGGGVGGPLKAAGPVQVIAASFIIQTTVSVGGDIKVEASANKSPQPVVGASVSSVRFQSAPDSSGRISVRRNDDHQSIGGSFIMQPQGMHVMPPRTTDWRVGLEARSSGYNELTGRRDHGACPSSDDEQLGV